MLAIFGPFVAQLAVTLLGWFIGKGQDNAKSRAAFLDLVKSMQSEGSLPAKMRESYVKQANDNATKAAEQWKKEHPNG